MNLTPENFRRVLAILIRRAGGSVTVTREEMEAAWSEEIWTVDWPGDISLLYVREPSVAGCEACNGTKVIISDMTCGDCDPCIYGRPDQCALGGRIERRVCEYCAETTVTD